MVGDSLPHATLSRYDDELPPYYYDSGVSHPSIPERHIPLLKDLLREGVLRSGWGTSYRAHFDTPPPCVGSGFCVTEEVEEQLTEVLALLDAGDRASAESYIEKRIHRYTHWRFLFDALMLTK